MSSTETASADQTSQIEVIAHPHPDIELGVKRSPLTYVASAPRAGVNSETGLVLYLGGYGMDARSDYTQSLLRYLSDRYNCVAAAPDYFGARLMMSDLSKQIVPHPDFFKKLAEHYGLSITVPKGTNMAQILSGATTLLAQSGIQSLPNDCILFNNSDEYNSMGFLPALDGLQLVHALVTTRSLNKKRIFLLGTSYGGYIAGMMAKPRSFRMIVDNSGFSSAEDDKPGVAGWQKLFVNGVAMLCQSVKSWSFDPRAANFFSEARGAIRDLARPEHVHRNTARIYAYHAATDTIAPTERKLRLREVYSGRVPYELTIIGEDALDGRIFKTPAHGMDASMRGIFDLSYDKFLCDGGALSDTTDFDEESQHVFACGTEDYALTFSRAHGVRAQLRAAQPTRCAAS
jgi:pimeloyl-ACP methyl ester carboxylesterase